jgi:signal transduction histidine kinase
VQRIAELHSAAIEVENRVMGGAQFSLHFIAAQSRSDT